MRSAKTAGWLNSIKNFEDKAVMEFFETSGHNLLAAEIAAGIKHHIALSVVGTENLQGSGYFRAKLVQEKLIKASDIPYSIVHATQFFEFVGGIVQAGTKGDSIYISSAPIQPISSDDVVSAMTDTIAWTLCLCNCILIQFRLLCSFSVSPGALSPI